MKGARLGDDAWRGRRQEASKQQAGEREVTEVVGPELALESVPGQPPRRGHHARVVDQQVDAVRVESFGEAPDRAEVGEVELRHAGLGTADRPDLGRRLAHP